MKFFFIIFFYVFLPLNILSQNLNYSQFYSSPLNLNPAMTGIGEFGRFGIILSLKGLKMTSLDL